jgi:hypothetical protein
MVKQLLNIVLYILENINVKSKRCIYENCDKLPAFNNYGETTADYCFTHKLKIWLM